MNQIFDGILDKVMEYSDGQGISGSIWKSVMYLCVMPPQTHWKTGWKVPEEQASRWMHQICSAIRHLHERDICNSMQHCDCG